ncbi:hypothetical protein [Runella sp. SP2]|uniref:hypothetical protein n=1 Tax=Runella sp. SP2 TaxID=2268026 RepID=UPI000F090F9D|nr:hypothetical protein [Runella sp. SP2]AYQ31438.1 hypothetical protein DTQ70_04240 [Runella sp. SP2]
MQIHKTNLPIEEFPNNHFIKSYYDLYIFAKEKKLFDADGNINLILVINTQPKTLVFKPGSFDFRAEKWLVTYTPQFLSEKLAQENYNLKDKHPELSGNEIHFLIQVLKDSSGYKYNFDFQMLPELINKLNNLLYQRLEDKRQRDDYRHSE